MTGLEKAVWLRSPCLAVFLSCWSPFAFAGEYYDQFCAARGTNVIHNRRIQASSLFDTNNTLLKVTNLIATVMHAKGSGELAGVSLGMTMEDVVATWGKPPHYIWSWCWGGPRLAYSDASAIFDPLNNRVIRIRIDRFHHLNDIPSPAMTVDEAIQLLGSPTSRTENSLEIRYTSARETLRLGFAPNGRLFWVVAERP